MLERKLSEEEKEEVFNVFYRVGTRMGLSGLPADYYEWLVMRDMHLQKDLLKTDYTIDLYKQYKKHLGLIRFILLREVQIMIVPERVKQLLGLRKFSYLTPVLPFYRLIQKLKMDWLIKALLLPSEYKPQIKSLDVVSS